MDALHTSRLLERGTGGPETRVRGEHQPGHQSRMVLGVSSLLLLHLLLSHPPGQADVAV